MEFELLVVHPRETVDLFVSSEGKSSFAEQTTTVKDSKPRRGFGPLARGRFAYRRLMAVTSSR
jgi:hypothetical protein